MPTSPKRTVTTGEPARSSSLRGDATYAIRAVDRVCDILDHLHKDADGASLTDIAAVVRLPKSTTFRYLCALEARRYVERDPLTGLFRSGLALLPLENYHATFLARRFRPLLEQLRDELGETVNLGLLDGDFVTYIAIIESTHSMRLAARIGSREYVHSTGLGKAIAAQLPETRVREIVQSSGMPRQTPRTIATLDALMDDLAKTRRRGWAIDDGENEIGGRCIAVPIVSDRFLAAVSVSGPASRVQQSNVAAIAARLQATAQIIADDLGADGEH